jgi:hypothetical protein
MNRSALILIVLLIIGTNAYAGVLPWGLTSTMLIRWEDDRADADPSVGKARLTLQKPCQAGKLGFTTQVYYEYDAYESFLTHDRKETDTGILLNFVALENEAIKLTVSPGYEYQDNLGANKDGLMLLQLKADL